ncbi:hypothetical protein [Streptomyces sp. SID10815]|uniref:hypothetical protein n=1 Tax=Streptomyces sp. SID10815 TaxID=2706027 RepID=UPI0013CB0B98|nr:hypothetical protein [Streptomyces sp. SID10815]NEA50432.1 hypothetical protein [Streptomyces sp. SID10815]
MSDRIAYLVETLRDEIDHMRAEPPADRPWSFEDERSAGLTLSDAAEELLNELFPSGNVPAPPPVSGRPRDLTPGERYALRMWGPPVLGG